jgi:hypothetical protein
MNDVSKHNGNASAAAPSNGRSSYDNLTEAEFLTHEAELAKTALGNTLDEIKTELAKAGNIKLWAHHYPWMTAGLALATGFTLAAVAKGADSGKANETIPASEEAERQRLLRETAKAPYNSVTGNTPKLGDSLLGSLFSLARTALEASLVSAIREQGIQAQSQPVSVTVPTPAPVSGTAQPSSESAAMAPK